MMLFCSSIPSFIQVKVSGGEPSEVHVNETESPSAAWIVCDVVVKTGEAIKCEIITTSEHQYKDHQFMY